MYFTTELNVLVVDDEPDVLSVTQLALRDAKPYGLPLKLHSATSKAQAIELLNTSLATQAPGFSLAAVALIDVVMETDHAGLELCQHIRETNDNKFTQIYVRTGQPGVAPERTVIDRYDINGYFSKVEATPDKLYTMIRTGVREYVMLSFAMLQDDIVTTLLDVGRTKAAIAGVHTATMAATSAGASGASHGALDIRMAMIIDDEVIAASPGTDQREAIERRDHLLRRPATPLSPDGDAFYSDGVDSLVRVAAGPTRAQTDYVTRGTIPPPDFLVAIAYKYVRILSRLWQQAS